MAKLPRSGISYQCLFEWERSLSQVIASLGLKPLSKKAECKLREELGLAIAKWEEPYPPIDVDDIVRSLESHASRLEQVQVFPIPGGIPKSGEQCESSVP
jgi:hypothetical protein